MAPPKKPQEKKRPLNVDWPEREGFKPFGARLGGLSLGDQGFLTGKHTVEPKRPKAT